MGDMPLAQALWGSLLKEPTFVLVLLKLALG